LSNGHYHTATKGGFATEIAFSSLLFIWDDSSWALVILVSKFHFSRSHHVAFAGSLCRHRYWQSRTEANCDGNYPFGTPAKGQYLERTCAVDFTNGGKYEKHPWNLCHMSGNVWQWCENTFGGEPCRVTRGGGWDSLATGCRSSNRWARFLPDFQRNNLGFRVALVPSGQKLSN